MVLYEIRVFGSVCFRGLVRGSFSVSSLQVGWEDSPYKGKWKILCLYQTAFETWLISTPDRIRTCSVVYQLRRLAHSSVLPPEQVDGSLFQAPTLWKRNNRFGMRAVWLKLSTAMTLRDRTFAWSVRLIKCHIRAPTLLWTIAILLKSAERMVLWVPELRLGQILTAYSTRNL